MTLDDLKMLDREIITPAIAGPFVQANPHSIRVAARTEPESLGFPVIIMGNRVKIPKRAFIDFLETGNRWFSRESK